MRAFLAAGMLSLCLGLSAQAQDSRNPAIESIIQNQIDAFRADDFATAFSFASPMIKQMFGSSDRFGMMVRQGYPMVWRPASVQFLGLREIGGQLWQIVVMRDAQGVYHTLGYQMIETPDGWQINGVQIMQDAQTGA
jgi:hypothetical protein